MSKIAYYNVITSMLMVSSFSTVHAVDSSVYPASTSHNVTSKSLDVSKLVTPIISTITIAPYRITRYSTANGKWGASCNWRDQPTLTASCNNELITNVASPFKHGNRLNFEINERFIGNFNELKLALGKFDSTGVPGQHTPLPGKPASSTFAPANGIIKADSQPKNTDDNITLSQLNDIPPNPKRAILTDLVVNFKGRYQLGHYQTITLAYDNISDTELRKVHFQDGILKTMRLKADVDEKEHNDQLIK